MCSSFLIDFKCDIKSKINSSSGVRKLPFAFSTTQIECCGSVVGQHSCFTICRLLVQCLAYMLATLNKNCNGFTLSVLGSWKNTFLPYSGNCLNYTAILCSWCIRPQMKTQKVTYKNRKATAVLGSNVFMFNDQTQSMPQCPQMPAWVNFPAQCNPRFHLITSNCDSPTFWQVVISLLLEMTPNSSTFEARKTHVGAKSNGSIHLKEFRA